MITNSVLQITNSLSRQKEVFQPANPPFVGMYVCGPTVYNDVHLGNCRTFVSFDVIYRYLLFSGYKVRYVRNITDVGHLLDDGEDRMLKGARLEQLEPMEVAQKYSNGFHEMMRVFNNLPPSIEPRASGHILEQIEMVQQIIANGYGYEVNGSVYFDTLQFIKDKPEIYGRLSGKVVDELLAESRDDLKGQSEKRHPSDFAIWIKASPEHIMRWNAPWSVGFPGWHLECSAMSTKYLGATFDIHGGGNDLKFPHHENEIAQNYGACSCQPARYWLHTNMLLMNGKKMSKSDGNTISPPELLNGNSPHISKAYSPMTLRFFMLQSHYGSTLDISDAALQAAEKGYQRLMNAAEVLEKLNFVADAAQAQSSEIEAVEQLCRACYDSMNDDFNTAQTIANLFELSKKINSYKEGHIALASLDTVTFELLRSTFFGFIHDVLGLLNENKGNNANNHSEGLMRLILEIRGEARTNKDWTTSDLIRNRLNELNIQLKDGKEGEVTWVFGG
ncbi:MAG: cysteine--tRNA ligase [Sphingobacteriales bacterium]|nr:cysteine--tRNA ligase [Sphingobacteriales bacterium]